MMMMPLLLLLGTALLATGAAAESSCSSSELEDDGCCPGYTPSNDVPPCPAGYSASTSTSINNWVEVYSCTCTPSMSETAQGSNTAEWATNMATCLVKAHDPHGKCAEETHACLESYVGSKVADCIADGGTGPACADITEAEMAAAMAEMPSFADIAEAECDADRERLLAILSDTGRRRMASGSGMCSSGHGGCQAMVDCQYDALVSCMESEDVPDDVIDATKSLFTCNSETAGCDDPARFRSGGTVAVCVLLAVLALGAAAYRMKNDAGTKSAGVNTAVNIMAQQQYVPPSMDRAVGIEGQSSKV
jgi:hypothetical protein